MIWKKGISVIVNNHLHHLQVLSVLTSEHWIFTLHNSSDSNTHLPRTFYLHFDLDRNYLPVYRPRAIDENVAFTIAAELKKHEDHWDSTSVDNLSQG
jgi:hypothetical protein